MFAGILYDDISIPPRYTTPPQTPGSLGLIDQEYLFAAWYKRQYERNAHLVVSGRGGKSVYEIPSIDKICEDCQLSVDLVFDRDQSYIEIIAKFVRDTDVSTDADVPDKQKMSFRFYHDAIADPKALVCHKVKTTDNVPKQLADYPDLLRYLVRGELWMLNIEYYIDQVDAIGVHDQLQFSSPGKLKCVETFRRIGNTSRLQLYVHVKDDKYSQAFDWMKLKMQHEKLTRPFQEYISKRGRYVVQWNNAEFGPERDTVPRNPTATFRDIDQFGVIQGYAIMRDAAYTMEATKRALQCPMTAAFVAMLGKNSPGGRPMRYLAFVQRDNEEIIRDALTVGGSIEFLFDAPKENAVPVGWKYTIRPPVALYTYPGNRVIQICRRKGDERDLVVSSSPSPAMGTIPVWLHPQTSDLSPRRLVKCANEIKDAGFDSGR